MKAPKKINLNTVVSDSSLLAQDTLTYPKKEQKRILNIAEEVYNLNYTDEELANEKVKEMFPNTVQGDVAYKLFKETYKSVSAIKTAQKQEKFKPIIKQLKRLDYQGKTDITNKRVKEMFPETLQGNKDYELFKKEYKAYEFKRNLIEQVADFARATKRNPATAWKVAVTRNQIEHTRNGTIKISRDFGKENAEERAFRLRRVFGANLGTEELSNYELDHMLPLQFGGMNNYDNLELIPKEVHATYSKAGNTLAAKLKAGTITFKDAQKYLLKFRRGDMTQEEVEALP